MEEANRERVGFWGTVVGLRMVECRRKELVELCAKIEAADAGVGGEGVAEVKAEGAVVEDGAAAVDDEAGIGEDR